MRLGAILGPVTDGGEAGWLAGQARRFEQSGYASLWTVHTVGRGFMMTDPFVALAVAATATDEVELGTAVVQVPLYPPAGLAHLVLSTMQLAGSRLVLGVGVGSTEADFAAHGRDHRRRFADFESAVDELRELFEEGRGEGFDLAPWPTVRGGPPLFLGSWGAGVERAAASYDGWIASAHYRTVDEIREALGRYRAAGGRRAVVSTIQLGADTDLGAARDKLAAFADMGFDDAVVMLMPGGPTPEAVRYLVV
jgi:alkanesulfonate monooxygenase SsuD/methylene tetrahydromethanopterin reductase-like flavin-dependent oxidoreductase (luciferase family)